jgi:hypothetical protein
VSKATAPTEVGEDSAARYRFPRRETRGLLLGLRLPQLLGAFLGLALLGYSLSVSPWAAGLALLVLVGLLAALFVPAGGRHADQWLPVIVGRVWQRLSGQARYRARPRAMSAATTDAAPVDLPGALASCRIVSVPVEGGAEVGVVQDSHRGTFAAVLSVQGRSFALLDSQEQDRRVASWGSVLAGLGGEGSPVHRVQWVERTVPDPGNALTRYWLEAGRHNGSVAAQSYAQLIAGAAPVTQSHETFVVLVVSTRSARRAIRQAGGGSAGATAVLLRELAGLQDRLESAEVDVIGALPPQRLAQVVHAAFRLGAGSGAEGASGNVAAVGPMAADASWASYRTDDGSHATYWLVEWPRMEVGSAWLAPLLLETTCRRTVSLVMEPVDPIRAARQVRAARTAEVANQALRDKYGQVTDERSRAEADDVQRRESELVAGHADYRFSGYLTVSATSPAELEDACGQVESAARKSLLEVRRLYGEQDQAFTFTLPLGRGLR